MKDSETMVYRSLAMVKWGGKQKTTSRAKQAMNNNLILVDSCVFGIAKKSSCRV